MAFFLFFLIDNYFTTVLSTLEFKELHEFPFFSGRYKPSETLLRLAESRGDVPGLFRPAENTSSFTNHRQKIHRGGRPNPVVHLN